METNLKPILFFIIFGTVSCVILGLVFFGLNVFNIQSPFFQFVSYGIVGSISFSLFSYNRIRDLIFINILLFAILYFATGRTYFLTHLLYFVGVVCSIYIYSIMIYNKLTSLKYVRPLILSSIFSIFFIAIFLLLTLIYYSETMKILPFKTMPIGFLIGMGLGIGFEISEYINFKFKK